MGHSIPKEQVINDYLVGVSGGASFNGGWIDTQAFRVVAFNVSWTAVAATNGTISFEATNDPLQQAGSIVALTITTIHGNGGVLTVGTSASAIGVVIENTFAFHRLKYTRSAGGGAGQFNAWVLGRSL